MQEASSVSGHQGPYRARRALITEGLAMIAGAPDRLAEHMRLALAPAACAALEESPSEPLLLDLAGVCLYGLNALEGAEALFCAALRLDPAMAEATGNLASLARRRANSASQSESRGSADPAALSARALSIAQAAGPARDLRISLCMIVRDEQEQIERCLAAARAAVDEMIVVDTGSADQTKQIAEALGARVIEHPWQDSFAEARNVSFDAASGDWLLYLDADEVLCAEDAPLLRECSGRTWREAFYVRERSHTGVIESGTGVTHDALRIFRNRPEYRFEGRLHEQIAKRLPSGLPERLERTPIRVEHFGYLRGVREQRAKSARNLALLQAEAAEGVSSPFLHFNIGAEYAANDEAQRALAEFELAWRLLAPDSERATYAYASSLASSYVDALARCGRPREAIELAEEALGLFPGKTDLLLRQANAVAALGDRAQAIKLCERCIAGGESDSRYTSLAGSGSYLPRHLMGQLLLEAGEAELALPPLRECAQLNPDYLAAILPLCQALLACSTEPAELEAELAGLLGEIDPAAHFMAGTALLEHGEHDLATAQFEATLAGDPSSDETRIALCELELARRNYRQAADLAGGVAEDSHLALSSARSELFARIYARDERAGEALRRAQRCGMSVGELAAFSAWSDLADGREAPPQLPADSAEALLNALAALLRTASFKEFELVLGAYQRTMLAEGERRHRLAELYARNGFVEQATREWMAICERHPEPRALAALAGIAADGGLHEQSQELARQALARDPTNKQALMLLSAPAPATGSTS